MQPLLLGSNIRDDNTLLSVDLTNPDIYSENRLLLPKDTIHIVRTVSSGGARPSADRVAGNHGERAIGFNLSADIRQLISPNLFEVRGMRRARRGRKSEDLAAPTGSSCATMGSTAARGRPLLAFDPAPTQLTESSASYRLVLPPAASTCGVSPPWLAIRRPRSTASFYKGCSPPTAA